MLRTLWTLLACVAATSALSTLASTAGVVAVHRPTTYDVGFGETVEAEPDEAVRLYFDGRRGQLVTLRTDVGGEEYPKRCESIALTRRGTEVEQFAPGLWRLPATGSFRVDYVQSCTDVNDKYGGQYASDLTLAEVVIGRFGDALRHGVDWEASKVRGVAFRLGKRPLLLTEAYVVPADRRTREAQNSHQGYCWTERFVAGKVPRTPGRTDCAFRAREGARYFLFGDKDSTVRFGRG